MQRTHYSKLVLAIAAVVVLAVPQAEAKCSNQLCNHDGSGSADASPFTESYCSSRSNGDVVGSFDKCCPYSTDDCDTVGTGKTCRTLPVGGQFCDPETDRYECTQLQGSVLYIDMEVDYADVDGSCCSTCQCYGDPNCISFDSVIDEWVLCDARLKDPELGHCIMSKDVCDKQTDSNGNACVWLDETRRLRSATNQGRNLVSTSSWSVTLQGSPCQPDFTLDDAPTMTMYKADGFKLDLTMGERGVITSVIITTSQAIFTLEAERCDDLRSSADPLDAWIVSNEDGIDIANTWTRSMTNEIDTTWFVYDPDTGIRMTLVCTKSYEQVGRVIQTGPPRINVNELLEPDADRTTRSNLGGFCETGVIAEKKGTTGNTDTLHEYCSSKANEDLSAAKVFCGGGVTQAGVDACKVKWCNKAYGYASSTKCLSYIKETSWPVAYCHAAALYLSSTYPDQYEADRVQRSCQDTIQEFSWTQAVNEYGTGAAGSVGSAPTPPPTSPVYSSPEQCAESLEIYLNIEIDECTDKIAVQYELDGTWLTAFEIPTALPPCDGTLLTTFEKVPELFMHPIRFYQCERPAYCSQSCSPVSGADLSVRYASTHNQAEWAVQQGLAHCRENAEYPDDKYWCLSQISSFEKMCECCDEDNS